MQNHTFTQRQFLSTFVGIAFVGAANLLPLQTDIDVPDAVGAEVIEVPAAPAPITSVEGPKLSLAAEREFYVPVTRREISLPELPAIRIEEIHRQARSWLGDGVITAPSDEILVDEPEISQLRRIEEVELKVPQLERPELPSPPSVRR